MRITPLDGFHRREILIHIVFRITNFNFTGEEEGEILNEKLYENEIFVRED